MVVTTKNFRIEGLEELQTVFQNLQPSMSKSFQEISGRYAATMYKEMTTRVPVRTGYLKSTIGLTSGVDQFNIYVTADYAGYVNYGTSRMKARPFFTAVVTEQSPKMVKEFNNAVAKALGGSRAGTT